jgi:hypothetical protein
MIVYVKSGFGTELLTTLNCEIKVVINTKYTLLNQDRESETFNVYDYGVSFVSFCNRILGIKYALLY